MEWLWSNFGGIIIVAGLVGFYILTYTLNKKTPIPEDCIDIANNASCKSCSNFACSHKG